VTASTLTGALSLWEVSGISQTYDATLALACRYAEGSLDRGTWQQLVPGIPYADPCAV